MKCPPLLYRFSLRTFRRYEPIFHRILSVHKTKIDYSQLITFRLSGSPQTHKARINDAYNSLLCNNWQTDLDVKRLQEVWPALTVHIDFDNNSCIVKPKGKQAQIATYVPTNLSATDPTELEFRALCVLQNYQTFPKIAFEVNKLSPSLQSQIPTFRETFPNVVFDFPNNDDLSRVILI